jgi:TM2 domain-containing membrane protein YozV
MYKIIGADGQPYGPVTLEQLRRWIAENRLNALTLVQPEGASDWRPLASLPELAAELKPPGSLTGATPPMPPLATTPAAAELSAKASSKIAAGVCGILLGSLGIHKFILGYTGTGLIMLLVSLLSCGILAPVISLIGIIEGIVYLTKNDEEFVRLYVDGRREWF